MNWTTKRVGLAGVLALMITAAPVAFAQNDPGKTGVEGVITLTNGGFINGSQGVTGTFSINGLTQPYVVPAGKRLVIENVMLRCFLATGSRISTFVLTANGNVPHQVSAALRYETMSGVDTAHALLNLRLYANAGSTPNIIFSRTTTAGTYSCSASWSGYEVTVP